MPGDAKAGVTSKQARAVGIGKIGASEEESLFADLIRMLSFILDLEESRKLYHAWRTSVVATKMAEVVLPERRAEIFYAALLHDIGLVGFADKLAHASLKGKELKIWGIRAHPRRGADIVECIPGLASCTRFVVEHHEWYNGEGYPIGKRGDQIAQGSQIIRLADSVDIELRSAPKMTLGDLKSSLKMRSGKEYPREIYDCFADVMNKDGLYSVLLSDFRLSGAIKRIQNELPMINIPPGIDAVGGALQMFSQVIDAKHKYTKGHSKRVAKYAMEIAQGMGASHDDITRVKWAALLHDAGKIAVPRRILDKPARLNPQEFEAIKNHPRLTENILRTVGKFREIARIAGRHHERYDGAGYPDGLKGEEIPPLARIISVADAFDGMTSARPYQKTRTEKQAIKVLHDNAGTQFDPEVVNAASLVLVEDF